MAVSFQGATADARGFVAGKYALELDGVNAGWSPHVSGGYPAFDVVSGVGSDGALHKQIGKPKYEDFNVTVGTGMSKAFYSWMKDAYDHKYSRKNGAIVAADFNYKEKSRRNFFDALITEIVMPHLDGASKDAAKMVVNFQPGSVQASPDPTVYNIPNLPALNGWFQSDFLVTMPDFPNVVVEKVSRVKVKFFWDRDLQASTGENVDNVVLVVRANGVQALNAYLQNELKGASKPTSLDIQYFSLDGTLDLNMAGVGVCSVTPEVGADLTDTKRFRVELYVEGISFKYTPAP